MEESKLISLKTRNEFEKNTNIGFFITAIFRGIGQVFFQENALSGLFILVAVFYGSLFCGVAGFIGVLVSTITAMILGVSRDSIIKGFYGFNGILVGIALALYLDYNGFLFVYIIFGSMLSTIVMAAFTNLMGKLGVPPLTGPFVLTTWFLLFGVFLVTGISHGDLIVPAVVSDVSSEPITGIAIVTGFLTNIAEVMFQANVVSGILILIGLFVNSPFSALLAAVGSIAAIGTVAVMGGLNTNVSLGLYGFNGVLCCIALGAIFLKPSIRTFLYAVFAAITATVVYLSITVFLEPFGMPAVTAPFVLTTWIFLWAQTQFDLIKAD